MLGDSLSAGYGLPLGQGWVSLLEARLKREGYPHRVANASISGETTAGGLARLPDLLARLHPRVVVLELGANDGLRGMPVAGSQANLDAMVDAVRKAGGMPLLVGIRLPPNYGAGFNEEFTAMYTALAKDKKLALVPFLFAGFAADPALFQADGLHPAAAAQIKMLDNVWPQLRPLLDKP